MPREIKRTDLVYIQAQKDGRCLDMLLPMKEIEKAVARAEDRKNTELIPDTCCTCWPIEKPPECSFWNRIMFNCPKK